MVDRGNTLLHRLLAILLPVLISVGAWADDAVAALAWNEKLPLPDGTSHAAGAVVDGKLYVLGGTTAAGPSAAVYFYDPNMPTPGTGSWGTFLPPLSEPRFASAEATDGWRIFLAGGGGAPGSEQSILAYDTASGGTYHVGLLTAPRIRASAAFLNGKMYIVGGSGTSGVLDTIEEYDPSTATSTIRTQLFEPRELAATVALNGRIYIIGGADANGAPRGNCWEYDPATNTIVPKTPLPMPLAGRVAVAANGRIFVVGGITSTAPIPVSWTDDIYMYEPASDTWSNLGPYPTSRWYPVAGIIDGTLYVAGGDNNSPVRVNEAALIPDTPEAPVWTTRAPLPLGMSRGSAATVLNQLFVLGGIYYDPATGTNTYLDAVQKYDPNSNSWQLLTPLPMGIFGAASAADSEFIYLAGGFDNQMNFLDSVFAYSVTTGETRQVGTLLEPRSRVSGAIVGHKLYVVGGSGLTGSLASIEEVDLATGASTFKPFLPSPRSLAGVEAAGGKIYIFGGYDDIAGAPTAESWEYDPATDMLKPLAPMPAAAEVRSAVAYDGKIYVIDASSWSTGYNQIQVYDILSNTWQPLSRVPTPRDVPVAGIVNGALHVIGGGGTMPVPTLNEALPLVGGWAVASVASFDPAMIDWAAGQNEPPMPGGYVLIGATYYLVANSGTGSWSGPAYNHAQLQMCDQVTGMPYVNYADMRGTEGLPIAYYPNWPLPIPDTTPPVTTVTLSGLTGNNGWYRSDVQVTLTAVDDRSGVAFTEYQVCTNSDCGAHTYIYQGPFMLGEGRTRVSYYSMDNAGNMELDTDGVNSYWKTFAVDIDKTPPTLVPAIDATPGQNGWYVSPVTISLAASDNLSGVSGIFYSLNGGQLITYTAPVVIDTPGASRFYARAMDLAGLNALQNLDLKIDTAVPVASAALAGDSGANGWYTSNVAVTLTATDGESGIGRIEYSFDGSTWLVYTAPFTISAEGITTIFYRAVDLAGNIGAVGTAEVKIDKIAPFPVATDPSDSAIDVPLAKVVTVTFSENVAPGTTFGGIVLKKGKTLIPATASLAGPVLTITPVDPLRKNETYTVTIPAGAVKDLAGHPFSVPVSFSFTTVRH